MYGGWRGIIGREGAGQEKKGWGVKVKWSYIRVAVLLCKTIQWGRGRGREKVQLWEAGRKEEEGLSEGVRRERMDRKERGKRCRGGKT